MTKAQKLEELMKRTGKSKMACDIALQLAGNDAEKAIERMKLSYPSMVVK